RLRDGVRRGEITCSIRIWMRPHVKIGNRYAMEEGEIVVDSLVPISLADITPELARASGFKGVVDLLKVAKHGRGENVYLVRFHYLADGGGSVTARTDAPTGTSKRARRSPVTAKSSVAQVRGYLAALPKDARKA